MGGESTNLAPSHFSFSVFEPDEKRDILYPLRETFFSDRAKVEQTRAAEEDEEMDRV